MKRIEVRAVVVGVLTWMMGTVVFAAPVAKYSGDFTATPTAPHAGTMSGKMTALYDGPKIASVVLDLDQAIYGKKSYASKEQWVTTAGADASAQLVLVFRLQGPPHPWYFVFVGTSTDGGITLQGPVFGANSSLSDIQEVAKHPIVATPARWDAIGHATLKAL